MEKEEKIEKLLEPWGWTLMSSADVLIDANEKLRLLSRKLGWLIPNFKEVDHRAIGIGKWTQEYEDIKNTASKAIAEQDTEHKKAFDSIPKENTPIMFNSFMTGLSGIYNMQLARFRGRIGILDDIVGGLSEEVMGKNSTLETLEKDPIKKAVKDTIETSKQIPTLIHVEMMYR